MTKDEETAVLNRLRECLTEEQAEYEINFLKSYRSGRVDGVQRAIKELEELFNGE